MSAATTGTAAPTRWLRRRVLVVLLVVSAALNVCFLAGAAWTRMQAPTHWPGFEERYRRMAAELDLDPGQRRAFEAYVAAMRTRTSKMQQQVAPANNAAWEEIAKPQADRAQVMRFFDEAAEKRREFQREATVQTFEFLAVLSPEQRGKFVAIARERRGPWMRGQPAPR